MIAGRGWLKLSSTENNFGTLHYVKALDTSISVDFSSRFSFFEDETTASRTSNPVMHIEFEELKRATEDFRSYSDLGEGAFGHFSKGWINENKLTASKPEFGTAVAVKKWKGLEGLNDCLNSKN
ncbi:hypothetical protein ABFS83_07G085300 [Erythranthe nasuta]